MSKTFPWGNKGTMIMQREVTAHKKVLDVDGKHIGYLASGDGVVDQFLPLRTDIKVGARVFWYQVVKP